jgi:hypothetical protein
MTLSDKVWSTFVNMKFKGLLFAVALSKNQKYDRNINIFLALAASTSIGAWAVWKEYPFLWGGVIAASQVVTTIKPYLPYNKMVKELNSRCLKMDLLNIEFEERLWNMIERGQISENTISERYYYFSKKYTEILNMPDDLLFEPSKDTIEKANYRVKIFIKTHYGIDISLQ